MPLRPLDDAVLPPRTFQQWRLTELIRSINARRFGRMLLSVAGIGFSGALLAENTPESQNPSNATVPVEFIDWVERNAANEQQYRFSNDHCVGQYFPPVSTAQTSDISSAPIEATADRSEVLDGNIYSLTGNVEANQGNQSINADQIRINQATGQADIQGNVTFREPRFRVYGDSGEVNNLNNTAEFNDVNILLYETQIRSDAKRFKRHGDDSIHLNQAVITTCPPGTTPSWSIQAESIDIREENLWGVARNPVFKFKGVPVFYLPFMTFPTSNDRLSGFLFPAVSFSDNGGLDVSLPYYFNLAPNYDLILSPRHINDRGSILESQLRHLSKRFESELNLAFLDDDPGVDNRDTDSLVDAGVIEEGEDNPFINRDRWLIGLYQDGGASAGHNTRWFSSIDFTRVSDQNYFRDLNNTAIEVSSETHLRRNGTLGYRFDNWTTTISATSYQTLVFDIVEPYQELPKINVDGSYQFDNWLLDAKHEFVSFEHSDEFDFRDRNLIIGDRSRIEYDLQWQNQEVWGFFTPGVHLKHLAFELDDANLSDGVETSQDYTTLQGSLDTGLYFEREGSLFGNNYLQTFEPRLFYFYSDFTDQSDLLRITDDNQSVDFDTADLSFDYNQLFRTTRFTGGDRLDDDHRLSVGLTTRFVNDASGQEVFRASIGQIYYFEDRRVFLTSVNEEITPSSEIAGEFSAALSNSFTWNADLIYDEEEQEVGEGRTNFRYTDDHRLINVGFNFRRRADRIDDFGRNVETHTRQSDISMILPVTDNVNIILRNLHDFTFDRELDSFGGLEYNSCCYKARFVWRRWLDSDLAEVIDEEDLDFKRGFFFDIQFKGLGSGQGKFHKLLSEAIPGFSSREQRNN
ncbi:LPS-assembly protein LptD [Sessilibacter corallicola]|uniref:LPS-assembly protein LptD n=1 Tax=Sessilibacter corallicola TaxID=2904075 RepID=UPI001E3CC767|nr:LPS-assembly protein LptD [Sessilibacter corallicola]MCE2027559.1 LPS-assembly protein LptD [Sessilibacter corallicola]